MLQFRRAKVRLRLTPSQYGRKCLNKGHNCPFSHPLEEKVKEAVAEEAGPNYKTKICEGHKRNDCSYGDR